MTTAIPEDVLRQAFKVFDRNGDGTLSIRELKSILCRPTPAGTQFSEEQVDELMNKLDTNKDGFIDMEEWSKGGATGTLSGGNRFLTPSKVTQISNASKKEEAMVEESSRALQQSTAPHAPGSLGVYLTPGDFSKRFGDGFFTATVKSYEIREGECCLLRPPYAVYEVAISAGDRTWTVYHRCSDWLAMWDEVRRLLAAEQPDGATGGGPPVPPTKTVWHDVSDSFLEIRLTVLGEFLNSLLIQYNEAASTARSIIAVFLGVPVGRPSVEE